MTSGAPRVVLVHPPPHGEVPFRHIGLAYLRAVLADAGLDVTMLDVSASEGRAGTDFYDEAILHLSRRIGDVADSLDPRLLMEVLHPDAFDEPSALSRAIVGRVDARFDEVAAAGDVYLFTVNTLTYYFAARMAHRLRAAGKRTAAGGPSLHFGPIRDLLLRCGAFDAVVEGEGEGVVVGLARGLARGALGGQPGVAWLSEGRVCVGPPGPVPDVDLLPPPRFDEHEVRDFVPVLASRGCVARCAYCSEPSNWSGHRRREPASVVAEMERAADRGGARDFHFHDDMINGHLPWFDELLDLLIERGDGFRWESFCGPRGLDGHRLARMRRSGCVLLKMGVQSFAPATLRLMKRGDQAERLSSAITTAARLGISMHYDMLTCFPGETEEDHRFNLRTIEDIFSETRSVYFSLNPFYLALGSDTHLRPKRYGLRLRYFDPDSLPGELAEIVRASGPHVVGFEGDLDPATVRRRVRELGALLSQHDRDYLYLGQSEAPGGSLAYRDASAGEARGGPESVDAAYRDLLAPWRPAEVRGGWELVGLSGPAPGEDGLVRFLFRRHAAAEAHEVGVWLAPRHDARPCFARTRSFNVFHESELADRSGLDALLRVVVKLVRKNEVGREPRR